MKSINEKTRRSFRDLSREFLRSEMSQHFVAELVLFAILFGVSAWPIFSLMDALK